MPVAAKPSPHRTAPARTRPSRSNVQCVSLNTFRINKSTTRICKCNAYETKPQLLNFPKPSHPTTIPEPSQNHPILSRSVPKCGVRRECDSCMGGEFRVRAGGRPHNAPCQRHEDVIRYTHCFKSPTTASMLAALPRVYQPLKSGTTRLALRHRHGLYQTPLGCDKPTSEQKNAQARTDVWLCAHDARAFGMDLQTLANLVSGHTSSRQTLEMDPTELRMRSKIVLRRACSVGRAANQHTGQSHASAREWFTYHCNT